jgi:hypothetical protein
VTISEIPFIPDLKGETPLHKSLSINNTRVTDALIVILKDAEFDHHSRFLVQIYSELLDKVPLSMAKYLDGRLQRP